MCQTAVISRNINRASNRSFAQNLEAVSGKGIALSKLKRLNNTLDDLYELIYSQFNDIDPEEYNIIGPQFKLLLTTLKSLISTCKSIRPLGVLADEVTELGRNYSALYELNSDIKQFRINTKRDPELIIAMKNASEAMRLL